MQSRFICAAFAVAALSGATVFAGGESLAETGGDVTTTSQLAFRDISLADIGTTYLISAGMHGPWYSNKGGDATVGHRVEGRDEGNALTNLTYQFRALDGSAVKCAIVEFTDGEGGVWAKVIGTCSGSAANMIGDDLSGNPVSSALGYYVPYALSLVPVSTSSINVNFRNNYSGIANDDVMGYGARGYVAPLSKWSNLQAVDSVDNTPASLNLDNGAVVTVTGTRGYWNATLLSATADLRHGYIDETSTEGKNAPTVTVANVPYDKYRVVVFCSTDTENAQFGKVTINGTDYSSTYTQTSLAYGDGYRTIKGDENWGNAGASNGAYGPVEGINYLVTPVLSGSTATIVGHRVSSTVRGCIAAIQIIEVSGYSADIVSNVVWSTKQGLENGSGNQSAGIILNNESAEPVTVTFDEEVESHSLALTGGGTVTIKFSDPAYDKIESFDFSLFRGEVVLDDHMQSVSFEPPTGGAVHYKGTATLASAPCASGAVPYTLIVDQPLTVSEFALEGVKNDYRFGEDFVGTFASRFVLGNGTGSNQSVTQLGGSIIINGDNEDYNNSSVLLGHWGNLTVNLNTYGGTFTATNAAARLGHTGKCYWTIGDGESADGTAVANLKGIVNVQGATNNGGAGSKVVLQRGGTLKLGMSGVNVPNATFTFAGGKLETTAESAVSIAAGTMTSDAGTDTEINTANGLTIASSVGGEGSLTKTGNGVLTLSDSATATGTLTVEAGTLALGDGVTWAGTISVGANGTIDLTDADVSESETVYIPVGGTVTLAEGATVKLNGAAINTGVWELSGGTFVNKTLKTAVTTATGDFAFTTATWESALGAGTEIDWAGSLSEVRVHANNASPATATVDVTASEVATFAVDGTGDMTFVADNGGITASAYDFSGATGRVEYDLSTGSAPVTSGSNTLLLGGGSGVPTVAAGQTLTLGPWGATEDDETWTYTPMLMPATGSTLMFSPGEGKKQKLSGGFGGTNAGTTIGVTNGMLIVNMKGGDDSVFFGANSVRIDDGGIVSLEAQDALGHGNARPLTINKGGVLVVNVRDTLRRTVNFNGGKIEIKGENSGRGLDFYGLTMNVIDNSSIDQLEAQSKVGMRRDTTVINMNDGKTLAINANLYPQENNIGLTVRAADGQSNQNGVVQLNGYTDDPKQTFNGTVTVGEANRAAIVALNCEHENGTYIVNAASRFKGTGSVTGNGGVTLAASNAKLCGSLTVNNLTAASGGTYGDQWNAVAAKVVASYFAAGTQTIENGSFAIGKDCVVTNAANAADTTDAAFSIKADGSLKLEKSVTVAGLTVADGGTITLVAASKDFVPALNVAGDTSFAGNVNFIIDFGSAGAPGGRTYTLMTGALPNLANVSVNDGRGEKKWKVSVDGDALKVSCSGSFAIYVR